MSEYRARFGQSRKRKRKARRWHNGGAAIHVRRYALQCTLRVDSATVLAMEGRPSGFVHDCIWAMGRWILDSPNTTLTRQELEWNIENDWRYCLDAKDFSPIPF